MKPVIVVESHFPKDFEEACEYLVEKGYRLCATSCGNMGGQGSLYQAIFALPNVRAVAIVEDC